MHQCYKNGLAYSVYVSNDKFKNCMELLMITDEDKSHYVYIKDFNRYMCNKTKNNNKKLLYCWQCFNSKTALIEHKEFCLKINGKQSVKLRSALIKFKNHFKHLAVPFKIYADFDSVLKVVKNNDKNNASYTKKI